MAPRNHSRTYITQRGQLKRPLLAPLTRFGQRINTAICTVFFGLELAADPKVRRDALAVAGLTCAGLLFWAFAWALYIYTHA